MYVRQSLINRLYQIVPVHMRETVHSTAKSSRCCPGDGLASRDCEVASAAPQHGESAQMLGAAAGSWVVWGYKPWQLDD